jgi:uroporphyrinogen III methyltransferase/synthase
MARRTSPGHVYLVGAGPGDPSLITLRGSALLQRADVVICDALAPAELMEWAPCGAERIRAGRGGRRRIDQAAINRLMIDRARRGRVVVRLKGGDPNIFGRAGEEAEALARAGIPFEIVPGVSAALGAAASAGIPLTLRRHASSIALATGQVGSDKPAASIDWGALAGAGTLAFYMGVRSLESTVRRLIGAGRSPATPAVLVRWATRPEQKVVQGSLRTIAGRARRQRVVPPAILIVGEAVRLRERLDWFSRRPLHGRTIVVTRPKDQAAGLSGLLRERGARVLEAPSIALRPPRSWAPLDRALARIREYRLLIFTSVNGVERFFARMASRSIDVRELRGIDVVAIGPSTAGAIMARGIAVSELPEEFRAEGILTALGNRRLRGERILIPRAAVAREILPRILRERGAVVDVVPVYRAVLSREGWPQVEKILREEGVDLVTFTSSATVTRFTDKFRKPADLRRARRVPVAAIGPVTAKTARREGFRVIVQPREYTVEALAEAIIRRLRSCPSGTPRG